MLASTPVRSSSRLPQRFNLEVYLEEVFGGNRVRVCSDPVSQAARARLGRASLHAQNSPTTRSLAKETRSPHARGPPACRLRRRILLVGN
jgi:hypothetical protein